MNTLSEGDLVYIEVEDPGAFACGDILQVFRGDIHYKNTFIKKPKIKEGEIFRIIADIQIVHQYNYMLAGIIRTSYAWKIGRNEMADKHGIFEPEASSEVSMLE